MGQMGKDRRIDDLLNGVDYDEVRKMGHCQVWYRKGLIEYYRYHDTDVAMRFSTGNVRLYHAGWTTKNTRKNMDKAMDLWSIPFTVTTENGKWYVRSDFGEEWAFYEGITLTPEGEVKDSEKSREAEEQHDYWKKQIDSYIRKLSKRIDDEGMVQPSPGDPWVWDAGSIQSQIEEKYVNGSMIVKAMEYTGKMNMVKMGILIKSDVLRSVRRYLQSSVGLSS